MQHYFDLFSVAGVVLSTQDNFYNQSAIVSVLDSEDRRNLCRSLTPLSLNFSGLDVRSSARQE